MGKESARNQVDAGLTDPLKEGLATHPVFLPGESHGQSNLAGDSPGVTESRTQLKR